MTPELDPRQFAALRQHFQEVCDSDPQAQAQRVADLALTDPVLATALRELLDKADPADLLADADGAALERLQFGPFKVLRRLGAGGMGEVFLAERREQKFEQRVALRRVHRLAQSPETTRRFLRERDLLARLDHPGIARLVDAGVSDDGRPWLAMEYIDGVSLHEHANQRDFDMRRRVALFRGVCAAVAYAHRHLIVHRDLTPANVMVTADGKTKLLDFGIAKLLDDSDIELTQQGARLLTLRHAAPEQVTGDRTTTATDVYALGVLLFELVAGRSAYPGALISGDWGRAALSEPPQPLVRVLDRSRQTRLWGRARSEAALLDRILRKAMAKSPADRYSGVVALDADLDDWLAKRPLRSEIGGAKAQSAFLLRRFRWPLGLTAAILLALSVGLIVARQQTLSAEREAKAAQAQLEAVLEVLGAANPGHSAGREPTASEFLLTAARQLEREHADRPALRRKALTEVGHGLLNLGKPRAAEEALRAALRAAEEEATGPSASLGVLALLVEAQDGSADPTALRASITRIESLVDGVTASTSGAVEALTRAAAAMARQGDFETAERLFGLAEARLDPTRESLAGVENLWRQRGWAALRANQAEAATRYLQRADRAVQADGEGVGELRRAEGHLLQVQAALLSGDASKARQRLESARAAYAGEYPPTHPEAAAFRLREAQVLLIEKRYSEAQAVSAAVIALLQTAPREYAQDAVTALLAQASALAGQRKCQAAVAALQTASERIDTLSPVLPRERAGLEAAKAVLARACSESPR